MPLISVKLRREADIDSAFRDICVDDYKREQELLAQGYAWEDSFFTSSRGLMLGTRTMIPPDALANGRAIIICHGYCDSLRWVNTRRTIAEYALKGYLVTGMEVEGHGLSDDMLALVMDIHAAVDDLHEFIEAQQRAYPSINAWFLHGMSMGGMFCILESFRLSESADEPTDREKPKVKLDGMVLLAPMCKIADNIKPPKILQDVLMFLSRYFPSLPIVPSKIDNRLTFEDAGFLEIVNKDPMRYGQKPRLGTAATMFNSTIHLEERLGDVDLPFIVMHGKKDLVTTPEASVELYERSIKLDQENKKLVLEEEGWHALLTGVPNPDDVERRWEIIFEWLDSRVALTK